MQDYVLDILNVSSPEERGRSKPALNYAYQNVVQRILTPVKSVGPITLTNLQGDYVLSAAPFSLTDFIEIRTVIYNQSGSGPNNTLQQITPQEVYGYRNQTWSGFLYAYAIEGVDKLMLVPSPSTSDTLTLVYNYRPALMATDSDTPSLLPDEDADAIVVGAAWRMSRFAQPERAATLEAEFQRLVGQAQARQNRKGGAAGSQMRRGGRRRPPHNPSTDWRGWNGY